mmetsp:Transcript_19194/g.29003  ORF Transcript_19194/g.29003 Transcript_19194/m.29003 type:complete len:85 (+) Transcript_19194:16-270(+)
MNLQMEQHSYAAACFLPLRRETLLCRFKVVPFRHFDEPCVAERTAVEFDDFKKCNGRVYENATGTVVNSVQRTSSVAANKHHEH